MTLDRILADVHARLVLTLHDLFADDITAKQGAGGELVFRDSDRAHVTVDLDEDVRVTLTLATPLPRELMIRHLVDNLAAQVRIKYEAGTIDDDCVHVIATVGALSRHGIRLDDVGNTRAGRTLRLTTKGRFAVAALIDLGLRQHRGAVTLAGISQRQRISLPYLERLFAKLRSHQLIETTPGPGGGYRLAKPMESVSVADVIFAVDDPLDLTPHGDPDDGDNDRGMAQEFLASLNQRSVDFLDSVSLYDLVDQHRRQIVGIRTE